jgi:hypothetical protein
MLLSEELLRPHLRELFGERSTSASARRGGTALPTCVYWLEPSTGEDRACRKRLQQR